MSFVGNLLNKDLLQAYVGRESFWTQAIYFSPYSQKYSL